MNAIAVVRTFIASVIDTFSTISIEELPVRIALILEAMRDPRANPMPFILGLSVATIVILILVIAPVLAWMFLSKDKTNRLYYAVLDDEGEVIERIAVEKSDEIVPLSARVHGRDERWARLARRFVGVALIIGALLVAFGASTQSRRFCESCHDATTHTASVTEGSHSKIACTACHETGEPIQAYTTNTVVRLVHVVRGLLNRESVAIGYGAVTSQSCTACHARDIQGVVYDPGNNVVRISHREPLEAGMGCQTCHAFNSVQEVGAPDRGMQVCLKCHNNQVASTDCTTCHPTNPLAVSRSDQTNLASQLLANVDPRQSCYRCHDPGPCDACHGIRMPHSDLFVAMSPDGHPAHTRGTSISVCFSCHDGNSTMGATACYACHPKGSL